MGTRAQRACPVFLARSAKHFERKRRRLLSGRLMEPTDKNRRAWDEVHRRRAVAMQGQLGLPQIVRSALGDLKGRRVLQPAVRDRRVRGGAR